MDDSTRSIQQSNMLNISDDDDNSDDQFSSSDQDAVSPTD